MNHPASFMSLLRATKILRPPKHTLATFGTTTLRYVLLSTPPGTPGTCRLRQGEVSAERPKIVTPEMWRERFEGFGDEAREYQKALEETYGEAFRSLEYSFRNELSLSSLEHAPLPEVAARTLKVMEAEDAPRTALLEGPDERWSFSIMKFIVETSMRSFSTNVRELDERGSFDPDGRRRAHVRREIEKLFEEARQNSSAVHKLGEFLKQSGHFNEYEDRFFSLLRR